MGPVAGGPFRSNPMRDCDHQGSRLYVRRVFSNGSFHICVQCMRCLDLVKLPEHNYRAFIKPHEVPPGRAIHDWIKPEDAA